MDIGFHQNQPVLKIHEYLRENTVKFNEGIVKGIFKDVAELTELGWSLEDAFNRVCVNSDPETARIATGIAESLGLEIEQFKEDVLEDGTEVFSVQEYRSKENGVYLI